jgi:hypothetical protein
MPAINPLTVQGFIDAGSNAANTTEQGRALEDLICYVFEQVPGIVITRRNQKNVFDTEEVDVAFWNDGVVGGFPFLPELILIEAKNWSKRVGSEEVAWFDTKIRNRGLSFGILVTTIGITGNADDLNAAHHTISIALGQQRRLIVLTTDDLLLLPDTDQLVLLLKTKLCDLALKGTIV